MALDLSAAAILEKNKLASDAPWLILLELALEGTTIRVVRNTEDITWPSAGGDVYTAFPFDLDELGETARGEIPQFGIRISNVSRVMQSYFESSGGAVGSTVTLRVVHADHLDLTTAEVEEVFTVTESRADAMWVSLTLGIANPMMMRFPRNRYLKTHCRWKFKSTECGYTGSETTCARTLTACMALDNTARFGGFPNIPGGGIFVGSSDT